MALFPHLSPTIAVVTNIDAEHLDHYGSLEKLQDAFVDFLEQGRPFTEPASFA
jgi:UDP-N-acetylmuramate--alanine ligase